MALLAQDNYLLTELVKALETESSALGTYFRSLTKQQFKDIFRHETDAFLKKAIHELMNLEDYEFCASLRELLDERSQRL